MHKDIALGLVCIAAFGVALTYVALSPHVRHVLSVQERSVGESMPRPGPAIDPTEYLAIDLLRELVHADLERGIAAVDKVVRSASGPKGTRVAMRCMSVLAEVNGPEVESALTVYAHADSKLVRLHAVRLIERRGRKAAMASALAAPDPRLPRAAETTLQRAP